MIAGRVAGLTLVLLGLGGTIAFELADRHAQPPSPAIPGTARPRSVATEPAMRSKFDIDATMSEILARPIFNPDRRPIGSAVKSVAGLTRLTGIVVTDNRKLAIFAAPSPNGHPVIAEEGSHLNAYEVKAISASGVTVVGPTGVIVMRPNFDTATPTVAKSTPHASAKAARVSKD